MSAAMVAQSSAPIGMFASMPSNNNSSTMTAVQSGPYTKAQCKEKKHFLFRLFFV